MTSLTSSNASRRGRARLSLLLTIFLALGVGAATLLPSALPLSADLPGNDKLHHLVGFAVLALPTATLAPRLTWGVLPLLALYGGLIEVVQPWVGRERDLFDLSADLLGLLVGLGLGLLLHRFFESRG